MHLGTFVELWKCPHSLNPLFKLSLNSEAKLILGHLEKKLNSPWLDLLDKKGRGATLDDINNFFEHFLVRPELLHVGDTRELLTWTKNDNLWTKFRI